MADDGRQVFRHVDDISTRQQVMGAPLKPDSAPPNLQPCVDCGELISPRAIACPHCGGPTELSSGIPRTTAHFTVGETGVIALFLGFMGSLLAGIGLLLFIPSGHAVEAQFCFGAMLVSLLLAIFGVIPRKIEFEKPEKTTAGIDRDRHDIVTPAHPAVGPQRTGSAESKPYASPTLDDDWAPRG